jgi:hypothetical protein
MKRRQVTLAVGAALALGVAGAVLPTVDTKGQQASPPAVAATALRPVSAFAAIADERTRAIALFQEAAKVITHPRCMNCHPAGERPTQTERMQPHQPLVVRGADGHGAPGMMCATCHHAANYDPAGVPGHPDWHLAPLSMGWQGRSVAQICDQIKDRARNGGRDMAASAGRGRPASAARPRPAARRSSARWSGPGPMPAVTARRRKTALKIVQRVR